MEKKILRKRQKQEQSDAIANELRTHGVADSDDDGEADSKTASFKGRKRGREATRPADSGDANTGSNATTNKKSARKEKAIEKGATTAAGPTMLSQTMNDINESGTKQGHTVLVEGVAEKGTAIAGNDRGHDAASAKADAAAAEDNKVGGDVKEEGEETQGRRRKARRKHKRSKESGTTEVGMEAEVGTGVPPQPSATKVSPGGVGPEVEGNADGEQAEAADDTRGKKQRRGWGKGRSPSSINIPTRGTATTSGGGVAENTEPKDSMVGLGTERWGVRNSRPRKKTRSKQKNIRKDKRPMEQRPLHLRPGDPGYSGRGLTEETRKVLGLPQDDANTAPPSGWSKPGKKVEDDLGLVIDTKPGPMPTWADEKVADSGNCFGGVDEGVAVEIGAKKVGDESMVDRPAGKQAKYKNLSLQSRDTRKNGTSGSSKRPSRRQKRK